MKNNNSSAQVAAGKEPKKSRENNKAGRHTDNTAVPRAAGIDPSEEKDNTPS